MMNRNAGKVVIIIIAAVLVVACSIAGVAVLGKKLHKGKAGKAPEGPTTMISIGELVVNLADTSEERYLKTDIDIEVCGDIKAGGDSGDGVDITKTKLRDAVIEILSSKHFSELNQPGGKDELKKEIIAAAKERLDGADVVNVYFNEFAMQ